MFKYMVNPSAAPKKSKRKNPELLIVNPYSLDEGEQKQRAKMSKKRRNPFSFRRRNPGLADIKNEFLGPNFEHVKTAALMAAGGGFSIAVGSALAGAQFGAGAGTTTMKAGIAILSGIAGGVLLKFVGEKAGSDFLKNAAVPTATGAMVLALWSLIQQPVENAAGGLIHTPTAGTVAGLNSWSKEFSGLGQSYYDEFTKGVAPGMHGLGQPVVAAFKDDSHNPFLHGYEPMGDIYNSQRLGSFEAESGLGSFSPENANPRDQQVADSMKAASGAYGGYEGSLFEPFIES